MSNVQQFDLTFTDLFGAAYDKRPAFEAVDDDGNVVVFCPSHTIEKINAYEKEYGHLNDKELKEYGIKATALEFKTQCNAMRDIVNKLNTETMIKILECLPRLANKSIRSTTLPVYMTGMTTYQGEQGAWCRIESIELAVEPWVVPAPLTNDPASIFAPSTKIKNTFMFDFCCTREYDKKDVPVINQDRTFNKVEYKRNSYIPMEKLIRGHIYMDKKDREFLYLGTIAYGSAYDWAGYTYNGDPITSYDVDEIKNVIYNPNIPYVFLSLNAKRKRELSNVTTFKEWIENEIKKTMSAKPKDDNMVYRYGLDYFKIAKSFKVTDDCGELFSLENLLCDIDITVGDKLTPKEVKAKGFETTAYTRARTIFSVIDKIPAIEYTIYEDCLNWKKDRITLLKTTDAKEAKKFMKEYLAKNPDRMPENEVIFGRDNTKIFVGMYDDLIAVDPK